MALKLNDSYLSSFIRPHEFDQAQSRVNNVDRMLREKTGPGSDFLGWMSLPDDYDREEFVRIQDAAKRIQKHSEVLIVIGIGGSYLGARAVIEFLRSRNYNLIKKDTPDIHFAGNSISAAKLNELIQLCEGKDFSVNVISKSGTTTEPAIAFRVFRTMLEKKYGKEGARERIFVTTDRAKGTLKQFSTEAGYETFVVPDDVGGRFSVLTAVGLLPIAVAGIDIEQLMAGAREASHRYVDPDLKKNDCYRYALARNILARKGKDIEVLASYEPSCAHFHEWWKQLYGESEGKDQRGIYPSSVIFSTDLHSLGQFIQDGSRNMFETVLDIVDTGENFIIPDDPDNIDGLNFLSGMDLNEVKKKAMQGTILAHVDGGVPNMVIEISERSEFVLGELIYFFELSCAMSGYLSGVNPFDQPGVEAYKKNMFALLGKPGYEDLRTELEERLKK